VNGVGLGGGHEMLLEDVRRAAEVVVQSGRGVNISEFATWRREQRAAGMFRGLI